MIHCNCCNVMTTTDCCISKMQIRLVVQYSKTQELIDLPSIFDVFKNHFSETTQSNDKITLVRSIKKIEVQHMESDKRFRNFAK